MYPCQLKSDKLTSSVSRLSSLLSIAFSSLLIMKSVPAVSSSAEFMELEFLFDVQRAVTLEVLWGELHNTNGISPLISNKKGKAKNREEYVEGELIKIKISDAEKKEFELKLISVKIYDLKETLSTTPLQTIDNITQMGLSAAKEIVSEYKKITNSLEEMSAEMSFENAGMVPKKLGWVYTELAKELHANHRATLKHLKEQMDAVMPLEAWEIKKPWWRFWC